MSRTELVQTDPSSPRPRRANGQHSRPRVSKAEKSLSDQLSSTSTMMTLESPPCRALHGGLPAPLPLYCVACPPGSLPPTSILSFSSQQMEPLCLPPSLGLSQPSPGSDQGGKLSPGQPEDYPCRWLHCQCTFAHLDDLVNHVNDHHIKLERPDVDYQCRWTDCPRQGRGFNARYKMLIHVRTHTNEKPHRCTLCGKSFSRLENLKIHHRSHTGEKPYVCPVEGCGKAYSNSSDRFKHVRTHQEEKPYICRAPGCFKRYTDPSSLRKHIRTHNHHFRAGAEAGSTIVAGSNGTVHPAGLTVKMKGSNSQSQSPPPRFQGQSSPAHIHRLSPPVPSHRLSPTHRLLSPLPHQGLAVPDGIGVSVLTDPNSLHGSLFTSTIIASPHMTPTTMATDLLPTILPPGSGANADMHNGLVMLNLKQEQYGHCQEGPLDLSRTHLSKKQQFLVATVTH